MVIQYATLVWAEAGKIYDAFDMAGWLDGWFTASSLVEARPGSVS